MAQSNAQLKIRPYEPKDVSDARFMVSAAHMEPLAVANQHSYQHPMTIGAWLVLSLVFVEFMDWWPQSQSFGGLLAYLTPLPAFAATAVPILFLYDWLNRPYFERASEKALQYRDLLNIQRTYTANPASGFHMLEYEGRNIGILALDASDPNGENIKNPQPHKATIRHFYVADPYRQTGVHEDLLVHALNQAFTSPDVSSVEANYSMLTPYIKKTLISHGFKISTSHRNGLFVSWEVGTAVLQRAVWANRPAEKVAPKSPSKATRRR